MKKMIFFFLVIILILGGCESNVQSTLKGSYQSEIEGNGYVVLISFDQANSSFVEYIDCSEVDRGTYKKIKNNLYKLKSDKQDFEITLNSKNSFEIKVKKINNGKPLQLKNTGDVPVVYTNHYDDADKCKALLN